jgi:hypothetical protein
MRDTSDIMRTHGNEAEICYTNRRRRDSRVVHLVGGYRLRYWEGLILKRVECGLLLLRVGSSSCSAAISR